MHLAQKQESFSQFVFTFFKYILNFEHFQKKMTAISRIFPKLWNPKHVVR